MPMYYTSSLNSFILTERDNPCFFSEEKTYIFQDKSPRNATIIKTNICTFQGDKQWNLLCLKVFEYILRKLQLMWLVWKLELGIPSAKGWTCLYSVIVCWKKWQLTKVLQSEKKNIQWILILFVELVLISRWITTNYSFFVASEFSGIPLTIHHLNADFFFREKKPCNLAHPSVKKQNIQQFASHKSRSSNI